MLDDMDLKGTATKYGDLVKLISGILGGVVALKMLVMPWVISSFGERGPAIDIHSMKLVATIPGTMGQMSVVVSKKRNCKPHLVALTIIDSRGGRYIAENTWSRAHLPMGDNQQVSFEWMVPNGIKGGMAKARIDVQHSQCKNGGVDPDPVQAETDFMVYVE